MCDIRSLSDSELVRSMREGSESAFAMIYERHRPAIHRFAYQMSGSGSIADEVTQEVFLALIRQPERFDPTHGPLSAFLHGIGRNHVLKTLERDRRYVPEDADAEAAGCAIVEQPDALAALLSGQEKERLWQAVLSLPAVYREALVLCDLEELDYEDAARRMNCPLGTVRSRLHRARALLAGKLGASQGAKRCTV